MVKTAVVAPLLHPKAPKERPRLNNATCKYEQKPLVLSTFIALPTQNLYPC